MPQAELLRLPHEDALDALRQHVAHHVCLVVLALDPKRGFQFQIAVEMILNRALIAPRHENQRIDPSRNGLFCCILNEWLIDDRQQLFRHGLSGRQETSAETGNGKYSFANGFHEGLPIGIFCDCVYL